MRYKDAVPISNQLFTELLQCMYTELSILINALVILCLGAELYFVAEMVRPWIFSIPNFRECVACEFVQSKSRFDDYRFG